MANNYSGFSTIGNTKKFRLTDYDLVKQDLLNNLQIRKGEKLGLPNFGTIIWDMLFEPLTAETKKAIMDDINTIISYDPRINTNNVTIAEYEYGIQIQIDLTYIPTNQTETLNLQFDRNAVA
jgi:phage baseplate assembly protein W